MAVLDPETLKDLRARIDEATVRDQPLLDAAIKDARGLVAQFRQLRPRTTTTFSLVASDGGHNRLQFNPFSLTVVRVVDSKGKELMLDAVSPTTDIDALSRRQFDEGTALARLMTDLGVNSLRALSPAMSPKGDGAGWVVVYRDLCEWATLYERIVHRAHANSTVFVRDGMLRTKLFTPPLFIRMYESINAAIERNRRDERLDIFLVGVAKHTEIHAHYELAMAAVGLPEGTPCWASIPETMQKAVYNSWPEYIKAPDFEGPGEDPKFNMGAMHFVRFGSSRQDRIWTVDVLHSQKSEANKALAALLADAQDGFPVPYYPLSLQKADEYAQIAEFDREILIDYLVDAVRGRMPDGGAPAVDAMRLAVDPTARRYE